MENKLFFWICLQNISMVMWNIMWYKLFSMKNNFDSISDINVQYLSNSINIIFIAWNNSFTISVLNLTNFDLSSESKQIKLTSFNLLIAYSYASIWIVGDTEDPIKVNSQYQ